jgi:hypothetical protein
MIKTHPAVFSLQRELSKADRKSVKNPVESYSIEKKKKRKFKIQI